MFVMHNLGPQLPHVLIQSPFYYKHEFNIFVHLFNVWRHFVVVANQC
jgi:hypothetical protein